MSWIVSGAASASRRYIFRTLAFMSGYVGITVGTMFSDLDDAASPTAGWLLALAVSAPVIGQIWATLSLMHESDEFMRAITAKQFILASGLAMAVASVWGFGETYAGAPHLSAWLIYPLFWACFGVVSPFVRSSRA